MRREKRGWSCEAVSEEHNHRMGGEMLIARPEFNANGVLHWRKMVTGTECLFAGNGLNS